MIKNFFSLLFIYTLFGLICFTFAQTQPWKKLQSPVIATLRFISFADSLNGWAAGEAGTIIRTTDGGDSWEIQNSAVQTFIMDIFFTDINYGWALTLRDEFPFNSVLLKTTNGGDEWTANDFPDSLGVIRTIFFFDSLNGFAGGSGILQTSDGGSNWTETDVDSNMVSDFPIYKFKFYSRQFGYACGGRIDVAGVVWKTTNYGLNWTAQGVSVDELFDLFIFDSLNAVTLSGDPEGLFPTGYIKTTNAGESWTYSDLPYFGLSFAIDFRTYNEGWSASGYKFFITTDRGGTWNEFETPDSSTVYDLQFIGPRTGYAAGENGVILKLDPTLVGLEKEFPVSEDFVLYQNYPNPFNPRTVIGYRLPVSGKISLKVYDIVGNEIAVLVDEYEPAGKYEVGFVAFSNSGKARNLSSGIYFYQLSVISSVRKDSFGEKNSEQVFIQTKKMVYLK